MLTTAFDRAEKAEQGLPLDGFDVVLANPPFSGKLDKDRIVDDVKVGTTTATEILFVKYMMDSLKPAAAAAASSCPRACCSAPPARTRSCAASFSRTTPSRRCCRCPGGVFQPYSGVKTSVLLFRKGGATERVMFLHADNDGYKLDANHDTPIEADDLPGAVAAFNSREDCWRDWQARDPDAEWTEKWWFADADDIRAADFNLSAGRYRPQSQAQVEHRDPLDCSTS